MPHQRSQRALHLAPLFSLVLRPSACYDSLKPDRKQSTREIALPAERRKTCYEHPHDHDGDGEVPGVRS